MSLLRGQSGHPLEGPPTVLLDVEELRAPGFDLRLALRDLFRTRPELPGLRVEPTLALAEPVLASLDVLALLLEVAVQVVLVLGRPVPVEENDREGGDARDDEQGDDREQPRDDVAAEDEGVGLASLVRLNGKSVHPRLLSL